MLRFTTILFVIAAGCSALAQSPPPASPAPSPKPATRPALDQFGLSSGVFANKARSNADDDDAAPGSIEFVDQETFVILSQMVEKSKFMEGELLKALSNNVDVSPPSAFTKYFLHHVVGLAHVSEVQRTGRFGGPGIKDGGITKLLMLNERAILEIDAVLRAGPAEYARFRKELNAVTEKYGVPLLEHELNGTLLDKPELLRVIVSRINTNFARLKKKMASRP